jgi:hypothetical protein
MVKARMSIVGSSMQCPKSIACKNYSTIEACTIETSPPYFCALYECQKVFPRESAGLGTTAVVMLTANAAPLPGSCVS